MTTATAERYMKVREVAELLNIVDWTVRNYANAGTLPVRRLPGGGMRFRKADVDALLEKQD